MHETLQAIQESLKGLITQLQATIPSDTPFSTSQSNWSFPGLSKSELISYVKEIYDLIDIQGADDLGEHNKLLETYLPRLQYLQAQTVPNIWGSASSAVPAFIHTLDGLKRALSPILTPNAPAEIQKKIKEQRNRLRAIEAQIDNLTPRTALLETMIQEIEHAHSAADQLPTDLASLAEARQQLATLVNGANKDCSTLEEIKERSHKYDQALATSVEQANSVLARCETAWSSPHFDRTPL